MNFSHKTSDCKDGNVSEDGAFARMEGNCMLRQGSGRVSSYNGVLGNVSLSSLSAAYSKGRDLGRLIIVWLVFNGIILKITVF